MLDHSNSNNKTHIPPQINITHNKHESDNIHTITIGGIPINFPYESPYVSQKQLMAKVVAALSKKQNAILESPTGSGKSLAILCSVLAWHSTKYPNQNHTNLPNKPVTENEVNLNSKRTSNKPPKIIFTSRTHGQLQQLIAEYRRTNYFKHFQMSVLGSRKSLCINHKIQPLFDRNDQCKKALDLGDCRYYKGRAYAEQIKQSHKFKHGTVFDIEDLVSEGTKQGLCPYHGTRSILEHSDLIFCPYNYILDPMIRDQMKIEIKNAVIIIDEAHNVEDVCRSALTKEYTLDDLKFAIDNLDNLQKNFGIKRKSHEVWESMSEIKELLSLIHGWMKELDETLNITDYKSQNNVFPQPNKGCNKIRDVLKQHWMYHRGNSSEYMSHAQAVFGYFAEQKNNENMSKAVLSAKTGTIIEYFCIYLLPNVLAYENDFNMALLPNNKCWDSEKRKKVRKIFLHFWCLSPSVAFKGIKDVAHSVILTSGTLSPLDAMSYELKCDFGQRLVADHVVEKGQVLVTSIDRGVNGTQIKCIYKQMQQRPLQDDLGQSLVQLFAHIPQGIVVFFSSYNTMQMLIDRWTDSNVYQQMLDLKNVYTEPRGSDENATKEFMSAIEKFGRDCGNIKYITKYRRSAEYKRELRKKAKKEQEMINNCNNTGPMHKYIKKDYSFTSVKNALAMDIDSETKDTETNDIEVTDINLSKKGAVFFGVCRGKISEGIDFSDGMSRAVIIVGIPYPHMKSPEIHFKKCYNEQEAQKMKAKYYGKEECPYILDGKGWYQLQAYRALNQALGRCIRHKYDYGAIIFLESRFGLQTYAKELSKWVRPNIRNSMTVNIAINNLIKPYFEYMSKSPPRCDKPGVIKWKPPFDMPKNWFSAHRNGNGNGNGQRNNRFFTQSPAPNSSAVRNKCGNKKNKNKVWATQSPAPRVNGKRNGFGFGNKNGFVSPIPTMNGFKNGNGNGNGSAPLRNDLNFSNRKRKYEQIKNETVNVGMSAQKGMNKRVKFEMKTEPNCAQCLGCSAMICKGSFKEIELERGVGKKQTFVATKQTFPCDTCKDCIWSSQLGLCFMHKMCDGCKKSLGFHVVGASSLQRLEYVGQILFLKGTVKLLTTR